MSVNNAPGQVRHDKEDRDNNHGHLHLHHGGHGSRSVRRLADPRLSDLAIPVHCPVPSGVAAVQRVPDPRVLNCERE